MTVNLIKITIKNPKQNIIVHIQNMHRISNQSHPPLSSSKTILFNYHFKHLRIYNFMNLYLQLQNNLLMSGLKVIINS